MLCRSDRREFLRVLGAAGVVSLSGPPPALWPRSLAAADRSSAADERVLVLVQLAGGNDGLNTVIPYADPAYQKARPGLGISKGGALVLNDAAGLHPSLVGLRELWDEQRLAIVQGVGYPQPDRSHFRSMDIWHSAQPANPNPRTGWLGRTLDAALAATNQPLEAAAVGGDKLPLALVAERAAVPTITKLDQFRLLERGWNQHSDLRQAAWRAAASAPAAGGELDFVRRTALASVTSAERLKSLAQTYRPATDYPGSGLAQRLKLVAQMLAAGLPTRVFFVSLDGFDTHSQQAPGHAALLGELSGAVTAFVRDLQAQGQGDRVLVATFSEFGRRVAENGSLGTDHGAASMLFAVTPAGRGGFYGALPSLTDLDDGDLKFTVDFRQVYATLLERWLGVSAAPVLGDAFAPLGFV